MFIASARLVSATDLLNKQETNEAKRRQNWHVAGARIMQVKGGRK
jgi:hypothetical protein